MENDLSFKDKTDVVLNLLSIIGGASVLLFLFGYTYLHSYYLRLAVPSQFLEIQYYEYIIKGLAEELGFVLIVLGLCAHYLYLNGDTNLIKKLNALNKNLELIKNDIHKPLQDRQEAEKLLEDTSKLINERHNITNAHMRIFRKNFNIMYAGLIIVSLVISCTALYQGSYYSASVALISIGSLILQWILIHTYQRLVSSNQIIFEASFLLLFMGAILTGYSYISGYMDATIKLKLDKLPTFQIDLGSGKTIAQAHYVYYGKDTYFFLENNKLIIIPSSELAKLEKE